MTTISAEIVADSESSYGKRITTMELVYPRFIHAEFMTHRQFSRNASSSRAIPVAKMIEAVRNDPVVPLFWGKNQKGMQAEEECNNAVSVPDVVDKEDGTGLQWDISDQTREEAWFRARDHAVLMAQSFADADYHKQVVNRLLEPFAHIRVVVTATEWSNFFALRDHPDAEPHIQLLAQKMKLALQSSEPDRLDNGQWHLPYTLPDERRLYRNDILLKLSVARCARVSYRTHAGLVPKLEEDLALYDQLVGTIPLHASPAEHQATPVEPSVIPAPELRSNLVGYIQYRKLLPAECS